MGYLNFLDHYQPDVVKNRTSSIFITDPDLIEGHVEHFKAEGYLDDREQSGMLSKPIDRFEQKSRAATCQKALDFLNTIHPDLSEILKFVIHSIFFYGSENCGGGSTSNAIGVIWLNPNKLWDKYDVAELLVHELTHNLVFLDELRHLHYKDYDLILNPENFSKSAILASRRPIDKVIHSIIVSFEILQYRMSAPEVPETTRVHPPSAVLAKQTREALVELQSMSNINDLTTPRTRALLEGVKTRLDGILEVIAPPGVQKNLKTG